MEHEASPDRRNKARDADIVEPVIRMRRVDAPGHDPDSEFVDLFWTPVLGPTALLVWRRLAGRELASDGDVDVDTRELATELGVGDPAFGRGLQRMTRFTNAWADDGGVLNVPARLGMVRSESIRWFTARLRALYEAANRA